MNKIKDYIPKSCELGGVEFTTLFIKNPENSNILRESSVFDCRIKLQELNYGQTITDKQNQNTYFHEIIHMMLDQIGEFELSKNEKFVQNMGNMLFEFLRTAEWVHIKNLKLNMNSDKNNESQSITTVNSLNE